MNKFNRNYRLTMQGRGKQVIEIAMPFNLEFDVIRSIAISPNSSTIRISNLNESTRNLIRKDTWELGDFRFINLKAGYSERGISTIFSGNINIARSYREGVNYITDIECFDGGFGLINGQTDISFTKGTTRSSMMKQAMKDMPGVSVGKIGKGFDIKLSRGNSKTGKSVSIIEDLAGGAFFVDNGVGNVLGDNECLKGSLDVIDSSMGILSTPRYENTHVTIEMLLEPRIIVGQKLTIDSSFNKAFNLEYKVISVHHKGTVSETKAGTATTTLTLLSSKALVIA